jgi:hypothetical protein
MITRVPALEFMQGAVCLYRSSDELTSLQITRCGYGQLMELRSSNKTQLAGVVGVAGSSVELFAQLGLPNVVRMSGSPQSSDAISFRAQEPSVELLLAIDHGNLAVTISLAGVTSARHLLVRA